jgi:hypothetical protein
MARGRSWLRQGGFGDYHHAVESDDISGDRCVCGRVALESLELDPMPRIHDLRHCWKTNAMRSGLHPFIADAIVGYGDRKKDVKSLYLTINGEDLVRRIDRLTFDDGKTEIWGQK